MGRAQRRYNEKQLKKVMSDEQYNKIINGLNQDVIELQVQKELTFYKNLMSEAMVEAMKKNGLNLSKINLILDDMRLILIRKVEEKKDEKSIEA